MSHRCLVTLAVALMALTGAAMPAVAGSDREPFPGLRYERAEAFWDRRDERRDFRADLFDRRGVLDRRDPFDRRWDRRDDRRGSREDLYDRRFGNGPRARPVRPYARTEPPTRFAVPWQRLREAD